MGVFLRRTLVTIVVLILLSDIYQTDARRQRLCKLKKKKGECVDIIPRKIFRRYKHCKGHNMTQEGSCAKVKGKCMLIETAKGRKICECIDPGRLFKDQPMDLWQYANKSRTNESKNL